MTRLLCCQNDFPMGGSFWQKDSLTTHILFELCLVMILSPVSNLMHHPLLWYPRIWNSTTYFAIVRTLHVHVWIRTAWSENLWPWTFTFALALAILVCTAKFAVQTKIAVHIILNENWAHICQLNQNEMTDWWN